MWRNLAQLQRTVLDDIESLNFDTVAARLKSQVPSEPALTPAKQFQIQEERYRYLRIAIFKHYIIVQNSSSDTKRIVFPFDTDMTPIEDFTFKSINLPSTKPRIPDVPQETKTGEQISYWRRGTVSEEIEGLRRAYRLWYDKEQKPITVLDEINRDKDYQSGGVLKLVGDKDLFWSLVIRWHLFNKTGIDRFNRIFERISKDPLNKSIVDCMYFSTPQGCNIANCKFRHSIALKSACNLLRSKKWEDALLSAATNDSSEVVQLLLTELNDGSLNDDPVKKQAVKNQALFNAVDTGNLETVKILVNRGAALLDFKNSEGMTVAHRAAGGDYIEIMKYLKTRGVKLDELCKKMTTPFDVACQKGAVKVVKYLIRLGIVDLNPVDKPNFPPLHRAVFYGQLEVFEVLIGNGADVNLAFGRRISQTPLHVAVKQSRALMVQMLVDRGAKCEAVDSVGKHAVEYALDDTRPSVFFIRRSIDIFKTLYWSGEYSEQVRLKLWREAISKYCDSFGLQALIKRELNWRFDVMQITAMTDLEKSVLYKFNCIMFRWVLKQVDTGLVTDVYPFIDDYLRH
ncbi:hypothetical protein HK098_005479 [Nowakowskiella sp. JEL0407]|nr:hypothetical protein HK098_005479 [Nowakowskiella sp. JEL0407]